MSPFRQFYGLNFFPDFRAKTPVLSVFREKMADSSQNQKIINGVVVLSEFDVNSISNPLADKLYLYAEDDDSGNTIIKLKDSAGNIKIILRNGDVASLEAINLNTNPNVTPEEGQLRWNPTDQCVEFITSSGVVIQIGQELVVKARNSTGANLPNGTPVIVNGATGNRPTITNAQANSLGTSNTLIGLVTNPDGINNNSDGYVTVFGLVRDLNTNGFIEGAPIYLDDSQPGQYIQSKPTNDASFVVRIGYVMREHPVQGVVLVSPQFNGSVISDSLMAATSRAAAREVFELGAEDDVTFASLTISSANISAGTGAPENVLSKPQGSLYLRTDGGAGTTFYVKESGSGNTGWIAK